MKLLEAIHQRWAQSPALGALVSADRVFTGPAPDGALPRAVLHCRARRPVARFNDGARVDRCSVRAELFDERFDHAMATRDAVCAAFDQAAFALAGDDRVLAFQRVDDAAEATDDGGWRVWIDFECDVLSAAEA